MSKAVASVVAAIATKLHEAGLTAEEAEAAALHCFVDQLHEPLFRYSHEPLIETLKLDPYRIVLYGFNWSDAEVDGRNWSKLHDKMPYVAN